MLTHLNRLVLVAFLAFFVTQPALGRGVQPDVQINANSVTFYAPTSISVDVVAARIMGPEGDEVFSGSTHGGALTFGLSGLTDGRYRYEVLLKVLKDGLNEEGNVSYRLVGESSGILEIKDGLLHQGEALLPTRGWLASALDWLIAPAAAQDVTVDSADPRVIFDDTTSGVSTEYDILGNDTSFQIRLDGVLPILLFTEATEDMSLGSGKLFLDGDPGVEGRVGFSTEAPVQELHAHYNEVTFRLESIETDPNSIWDVSVGSGGQDGDFGIELVESAAVGHPTGTALTIEDLNGRVGIWDVNPEATLHVTSPDTSTNADLLVENRNAASGNVNLLTLSNASAAPFQRYISAFRTWDFTGGNFFSINDPSDAAIEFLIDSAGNLTISGVLSINGSSRESKHDIQSVDVAAVLDKVLKLPISEWSYKQGVESRHMGPMAEDFHATFGLGVDDKGIATLDTSGVALAAIQGLHHRVEEKDRQFAQLLKDKDLQIAALKDELAELRQLVQGMAARDKLAEAAVRQ